MDGLVQERYNSIALAMELRLSCSNPSICPSILCQLCYTERIWIYSGGERSNHRYFWGTHMWWELTHLKPAALQILCKFVIYYLDILLSMAE